MENHEKLSTVDFISSFLVRFKIPLIVVFIAIAVILIGLAVGAVVVRQSADANAAVAEEISDAYDRFESAGEADKEDAKAVLTEALEKGKAEKKGSYAFVRALLCESQMSEAEGNDEKALEVLSALKELKSDSYLIPIGLHRAAVLAEKSEKRDEALAYYYAIEKNYGKSYFNIDRVYYNIARLEELSGNTEQAKKIYRKLIESAPSKENSANPSLVSIAKDRLIYLETAVAEDANKE